MLIRRVRRDPMRYEMCRFFVSGEKALTNDEAKQCCDFPWEKATHDRLSFLCFRGQSNSKIQQINSKPVLLFPLGKSNSQSQYGRLLRFPQSLCATINKVFPF